LWVSRRVRYREATAVSVASSESVSTSQGDDLLVVESHAVEDVSDVSSTLSSVGKSAFWRNNLGSRRKRVSNL